MNENVQWNLSKQTQTKTQVAINVLHHRQQQKHLTAKNKRFVICLLINIFQQSCTKSNITYLLVELRKSKAKLTHSMRFVSLVAGMKCKRNLLMNSRWVKEKKKMRNVFLLICFELQVSSEDFKISKTRGGKCER